MAITQELLLLSPAIGTRDYLPVEFDRKTFGVVKQWLYEMYGDRIETRAREQQAEARVERTDIHFEYADTLGAMVVIDPSERVEAIKQITDTVHWTSTPVGG